MNLNKILQHNDIRLEQLIFQDPNTNIKIFLINYKIFNNILERFLTILNNYLKVECGGVSNIDDIRKCTSQYFFYIITDINNDILSYFNFKQISILNQNDFELWDVCRLRKTGPSSYKNISKESIKKIIEMYLSKNTSFRIWLSVYIPKPYDAPRELLSIQYTLKLIKLYSDIGFTSRNICSSNILSPSGIKLGGDYERMYLDSNSFRLDQTQRNISNFIWDYNCFYNLQVNFYLSKRLVAVLQESLKKEHEYGFGFYMNLKNAHFINNCKISLIKGSEKYSIINKTYEFNKNCATPPLDINSFASIHTHPKICYNIPGNLVLKINPFSLNDIRAMLQNNYRFMLTPSTEGLHFIKLKENVRNFIYLESNNTVEDINYIINTYANVFVPKIINEITKTDITTKHAIEFYKRNLENDFKLNNICIFFYKLFDWPPDTDKNLPHENLHLYKDSVIL